MTGLADAEQRVRAARISYERRAGAAQELLARGARLKEEVADLQAEAGRHAQVNELLTSLGEKAQQDAQDRLEGLVTSGLQAIFGQEFSFRAVQSVRAGQPVIDFMIRSRFGDAVVDTPVLEARGGGMAAVTGFMIRLVVLLLTSGARRILVLDESFGHVSREYEPRLAEFLADVARQADIQVFLVTHSDAFDDVADEKCRVTLGPDGVTRVVQSADS